MYLIYFTCIGNNYGAKEEESPTKNTQLSYAVLDLSQPTSNINHSPSFMMNATGNRSPFYTPNPDSSPTNPLSKSADSLLLGNAGALLSNGIVAQQEEKIECEYTHIDLNRTQAYLESKLQNENQFGPFDGAASISISIPEDRVISTNGIREGNNNPLTKAFTAFGTKRNSVISQ